MSESASAAAGIPRWGILPVLLVLELVVFSIISPNFLSFGNGVEVTREAVELGLLATAMTPVILTGGIDLSVGSTLGLCVVVTGALWESAGLPLWLASVGGILTGCVCGAVNGLVIVKRRVPPLIVTLATFSLYRGIAQGATGGAKNYTHFPAWFLFLGHGQIGPVPVQLIAFVLFAAFVGLLVHRGIVGRQWSAIGFSPDGARYAAIPVQWRIASVYVLSGLAAGIAAVVYAAHLGEAKADAGTGYELDAITAVVLGGTSIFGGRGSVPATWTGLAVIAVLINGLGLAGQPVELGQLLTGGLLLAATGMDRLASRPRKPKQPVMASSTEELDVRNSQVMAICGTILVGALLIVGGNVWLVRSLKPHKLTIAMMPKEKGNPYFVSCRKGAEEAAAQAGVDLIWDGPTGGDAAAQTRFVETWITRKVDVIAVSVENSGSLAPVLEKARKAGIHVVTFDADVTPDAAASREFFVNQATAEGIGNALTDDAAAAMNSTGDIAIITSTFTAANQNQWIDAIKARLKSKYPNMHLVTTEACNDDQPTATEKAKSILGAYPSVKVVVAVCSPAVPGAAEAVDQSGRKDVKVVGLGTPNANKKYVEEGTTTAVVLWNTNDLGYLTVYAAKDLCEGTLKPGDTTMPAGRMGSMDVKGDNVMLGTPFTFNKENIGQFDF
jgi:rhamnose transport system substrate-binding protein